MDLPGSAVSSREARVAAVAVIIGLPVAAILGLAVLARQQRPT